MSDWGHCPKNYWRFLRLAFFKFKREESKSFFFFFTFTVGIFPQCALS